MIELSDQELNEAVARKLGWEEHPYPHGVKLWFHPIYATLPVPVKDYCHSIAAAWEIIEILETGWIFKLHHRIDWNAEFFHDEVTRHANDKRYATSSADTAPKAICLAFLKLP